MSTQSFRNLEAWQRAVDLAVDVYKVTHKFPSYERFELSSQIRKAVVSISSNIAEGRGRHSDEAFRYFLEIAHGSLCELESQLVVAERLGFVSPAECAALLAKAEGVAKPINGLLRYLSSPASSNSAKD